MIKGLKASRHDLRLPPKGAYVLQPRRRFSKLGEKRRSGLKVKETDLPRCAKIIRAEKIEENEAGDDNWRCIFHPYGDDDALEDHEGEHCIDD